MADEDLTASHWDDVYADSPFASKLPNILHSEEFAPPTYDESSTQSKHDEPYDQDQHQHQHQKEHLHDNISSHSHEYSRHNEPHHDESQNQSHDYGNDDASIKATKSVNNESKVKNQSLLSSLTKDIDDAPLSSSTFGTLSQPSAASQKPKDDLLFSVLNSLDNKFNEFSAASSNEAPAPSSAKKLNPTPIKMFKAPRARRNKLPVSHPVQKNHTKEPQNRAALPVPGAEKSESTETLKENSSNPLGPLGESLQKNLSLHDGKESDTRSAAARLVESANAPLYNIRKPTSPSRVSSNHKILTENPTISAQIGEYFQKKEQDKLQKTLPKKPEPEADLEKIEINVGDPTKVGDLTSAHIVYTVRAATESNLIENHEVVVTRRYKDFRWLYHQLQSNNPGYIIPPPPLKQAVGRFNEQFIESRRFALEKMLQKIAASSVLQKDPDFLMLLQSSNFSAESKEREKITGSGASTAGDDYEKPGGSASSGSSGGFMSALGGAFSFSTKVTDQDEFFLDQKAYVEDLDLQLKSLYKNFELIVQQRNELSAVTEEFANAVDALADIETSKNSSTLLSQFAHTHHRIKELLERQSMQDLITFGSVLDEYIRLLGSIRAVFGQRHKALVASTNADYELSKKQASLEKLTRNHRNQIDKIEAMKREVGLYETKSLNLKVNFDNISNTIKKELSKFEFEKIDDFRNAVETFLESLIESQKEAIELWETFYDRQKLDEVEEIKFDVGH